MEKMKILFILGILLLTFNSNAQDNRYIKTDAYEGVIFAKYCFPNSEIAQHPYIPSDREIATMEKKISDSIGVLFTTFVKNSYYKGFCDFKKDLAIFKRQYYCYSKDGDKIVLVFFYRYVPQNWKETLFPREQGGWCNQFHLNYSIKTGKLFNFFTDLSPE
jgi:hypothetical protein